MRPPAEERRLRPTYKVPPATAQTARGAWHRGDKPRRERDASRPASRHLSPSMPLPKGGEVSITYTCDYCGEPITGSQQYVVANVSDSRSPRQKLAEGEREWHGGWAGHYHAVECFGRLDEALAMIKSTMPSLEARGTLKEYEVRQQREKFTRPGESIQELEISQRAYRLLSRREIYTIDRLAEMPRGDLMAIPGMGWKSLQEITDALEQRGLNLRGEER